MQWLEPERTFPVPAKLSLLKEAVARRPGHMALRVQLGNALYQTGDYGAAADVYEHVLGDQPEDAFAWTQLASCYVQSRNPDRALAVCERGQAQGYGSQLHFNRARALAMMGDSKAAQSAFMATLANADGNYWPALKAIMKPLAIADNGQALLDFCDTLPENSLNATILRAHRAIALSRLGQTDQAMRLIDLERYVARVRFEPPPEFGGIDRINRMLADEILADPAAISSQRDGLDINYQPNIGHTEAFCALRNFFRAAFETYCAEAAERGLDAIMPAPPPVGILKGANVVLRGAARNGQHLHGKSYISAVYHVSVPDNAGADDRGGALVLGACDEYTKGYAPCWGTRDIKPIAGWLTIFPSHFFHDVVPTLSDTPRISVVMDLRAAETAETAQTTKAAPTTETTAAATA